MLLCGLGPVGAVNFNAQKALNLRVKSCITLDVEAKQKGPLLETSVFGDSEK